MRAALAFLERHATAFVTLLAFVVRALQNVFGHPLLESVYSDMSGYFGRARDMFDKPWGPTPGATFFPYGTHFLVYGVQRVFGRQNGAALGLAYAAIGTIAVTFTYLAARRALPGRPRLAFVVGVILAAWVPWVRMGGFILSEPPLAATIAVSSWAALRLAQEGRKRDAFYLGAALAVGATFRPQLLVSAALLLVLVAFTRRKWKAGIVALPIALLPIVLVLGASAARMHYHTGHYGLVSTNGGFNLALGRCHPVSLTASKSPRSSFTPPSFNGLDGYEKRHGIRPLILLDPAMEKDLVYDGQLWDQTAAVDLAKRCVAKTGPLRQAKYSVTHVMLLWLYNGPWPAAAGVVSAIFAVLHFVCFLPGLVIGLVVGARRRDPSIGILAMHFAAVVLTAMIFFGEARLRLPYDGVILTIAVYGYAAAWPAIVSRVKRFRERRAARKESRSPVSEAAGRTWSFARSASRSSSHMRSNLIGARNFASAPRA